jgi:hypothetical protein
LHQPKDTLLITCGISALAKPPAPFFTAMSVSSLPSMKQR